jgi:peptide-methionine (S)-S-oxide reductase
MRAARYQKDYPVNRRFAALAGLVAFVGAAIYANSPLAQSSAPAVVPQPAAGQEVVTLAGGCFWCVEADFDKVDGVIATTSGFMGGHTKNPTYRQVVTNTTGHLEVVQIIFDPKKVTFDNLLAHFWRTIDVYDDGGQFCDRGDSYRTAVFVHNDAQKKIADAQKAELAKGGPEKKPLATRILPAGEFTAAEDYHQDFYKKDPARYYSYRAGCRRDTRLDQLWGKKPTN